MILYALPSITLIATGFDFNYDYKD
uniref:Uncharacterized protein n=1 Tax=Bartonella rochalimae ATCC BAA-1498 TaxID=685782 RepID=E6YJV9_9HYPH|nr:hypothetical protein BARRO_10080 [Bartonella rochalimae ATCC BAA-1498]